MSLKEWSDLHGEETGRAWRFVASRLLAEARRARELQGLLVFCRNCQDYISPEEMKPYRKDDETVDMLCPGCDAVLVEGE